MRFCIRTANGQRCGEGQGPRDPIQIQELTCRIVGLLVYELFDIIWSVDGDKEVLWSMLGVLENDDFPAAGTSPRLITVADDLGTLYEGESRAFTRTPTRSIGHVTSWPAPPAEANLLRLGWMDRFVEIAL